MRAVAIPDCTHRPTCPGCPRYAEAGIAAPAWESLQQLAGECGARLDSPIDGNPLGYRQRARLMVRGRAGSPKVGLFQNGTHRIADIPRCHVQHPKINEAAAALKRAMKNTQAEPYADGPHRGLVRALQVVVERSSQTLQVVLVTNGSDAAPAAQLLEQFSRGLGASLHSLFWNGNSERSNAILGPHWQRVSGEEAVRESIGGADVFFPPGAFGQSHLDLADQIVARIHAEVPAGGRVGEFYAGCGAIGLGLLARGHAVAFNEQSVHGLRGLELGLAAQSPDAQLRSRVLAGSAGEHATAVRDCELAIADPPRKGLDAPLLEALTSHPPAKLVLLSCDVGSLVRDARGLVASSCFALRRLTPFALFPFTDHVETLAIFERS